MGLDAQIYVQGDLKENKRDLFYFNCHIGAASDGTEQIEIYGYSHYDHAFELDRVFTGAYPRGNWPEIYGLIRACKDKWPNAKVFYTDDHSASYREPANECTDEFLADMWRTWLEGAEE